MVVQVLKKVMIEKGELAITVEEIKNSKNEIHLLGRCWERQTTSLIVYLWCVG